MKMISAAILAATIAAPSAASAAAPWWVSSDQAVCTTNITAARLYDADSDAMIDSRELAVTDDEVRTFGTYCERFGTTDVVREIYVNVSIESNSDMWTKEISGEVLYPLVDGWTPVYEFAYPSGGVAKVWKVYDGTTLRYDGSTREAFKFEMYSPYGVIPHLVERVEVAY
jgi:hypothetical protein